LIQGCSDKRGTTSFRLVHGEADGLPGLMIDRVGDELRVLSLWQGSAAFERETIDAIIDALGRNLGVVMVRHFSERPKGQFLSTFAYGGNPSDKPFVVKERGLLFEVDTGLGEPLRSRPGFGLYIDQRDNRESVANQILSTGGGRWLNLFCHTGAFSVAALAAGADEVTSVDLSNPYLMTLERNLELNTIDPSRHTAVKMDVQRYVEKLQKNDRFDGIIIDPPTASAAGKQFWSVRKNQARLVEECLKHLSPGGVVLVCRNDHGAKESLRNLVNRASQNAGVKLQGMIEAGPGADFPSIRAFREGEAFEGVFATRK
ncbi:MAG: class I SAM-dependent methyltransferase, partial [Myxococcota bacterium]